jgi:hypothetical protein
VDGHVGFIIQQAGLALAGLSHIDHVAQLLAGDDLLAGRLVMGLVLFGEGLAPGLEFAAGRLEDLAAVLDGVI